MKRTPWPVLERRHNINGFLLFLILTLLTPFLHAAGSHHMVISSDGKVRVGKNQIKIQVQTTDGQLNAADNRLIKLEIYSNGRESRSVQIIGGLALVDLDLQKGPALLVASDPNDPLFLAYKDLMAEEVAETIHE